MEELLSTLVFRNGIIPAVSVVLGVYVKYVSRNDQYARFRKEDIAVGLDLIRISALSYILFVADWAVELTSINSQMKDMIINAENNPEILEFLNQRSISLSSQVEVAGWNIALLILLLWSISTIVRKWGWSSETEMKPVFGIAFPLVIGLLTLLYVIRVASL